MQHLTIENFDIQVAKRITEIDKATWDRLSEGFPFTSYRWYRFGEAILADGSPLYIILSRDGAPVARATFWFEMQEEISFVPRFLQGAIKAVLRRWPIMICRSPLFPTSGLVLPNPPLDNHAALHALLQAADKQAQQHHASFILFDHLEAQITQRTGWTDPYTQAEFAQPGTYLEITWPDFESYLKQLSKSTRKDYRRHRNRAADLGIEIERHHSITTPIDQALTLINNVEEQHGSSPSPWTRALLTHADMIDTIWLTAKIEGKLMGCGLLLGDGDALFLALLGLDYSVQYVYFQLVYESLRCAIEEGYRLIRGGREAYRIKERLGFQLENNNYVMFAGQTALLQRLGRWLAGGEAEIE